MNAYPDARWVGLEFKFEFIDQKAREDATAVSSSQHATSQFHQIMDEAIEQPNAYTYLEHNRWGLNWNFTPLPNSLSGHNIGWICSSMSNAECTFDENPYLEFSFSETHSSIGFSVYFEASTGNHASRILVETFDIDDQPLTSAEVENHSAVAVINLLTPNYKRVRITFLETSRPYSRVRVSEVLFGIIERFTGNEITTASLQYAVDPIAESLPSREAIVSIDNSDQRFNLINPNGIYAYLQQPQSFFVSMGIGETRDTIEYVSLGEFFFATATAEDSGLTATISAYDWFYWMEKGTYQNAEEGEWTLQTAVEAILLNAGISCEVVMPNSAAQTMLRKVTDEMTHREALRLAVQAACCTAYFDRAGTLVICDLAISSPVDVLDSSNMVSPPRVAIEEAVNTVEVRSYDSAASAEVIYTAVNILNDEMSQKKSVNNTMVHPSNGQRVADWILARCQGRISYTTAERGNPATALGETVKIYDHFKVNRNAVIISQTFEYNGGLSVGSEAISNGA